MAFMTEIINKFLDWVLALLPFSPFAKYIDELETLPYLPYLNWFLPIGDFIVIGSTWLVSIGVFYLYSIILRWLKAIQ